MVEFDFRRDYVLEDEAARLIPLRGAHVEDLVDVSGDPNIWTYFLESGQGPENLPQYVRAALSNRQAGQEYPFAVFDKKAGHYVGMTRLYAFDPVAEALKIGHTWYGTDVQGSGLNKHCKYLLFEFVFETLGAWRIGFGVHAENVRSLRALARVGCRREGVLREVLPRASGEGRADLVLLSLLSSEWRATVRDELRDRVYGMETADA